MIETTEVEGFTRSTFAHDGIERTVYRRGAGPAVVVIHEIPGITPPVAAFARRVADAGFTAFVPHLFGAPNRPMTPAYALGQMAKACVSREFKVLAAREASPATEWTRALARKAFEEIGGKGVGAIGMCLTGNFALAMAVDPFLMAPVLSQPSLPFPIGAARRAGLHVSDEQLVTLKRRVKEDGLTVLGLRFTGDPACPKERFERLRAELGDGFEAIEIDSSKGNPFHVKSNAHSVVTTDLVDEAGHPTRAALDRVLSFFREKLM
ncbi:MAG TPA: dienelactone hydrolase family protein [Minicystis sp.]|nr:dienelactone hydrolase family protein [Minicystis sp.]